MMQSLLNIDSKTTFVTVNQYNDKAHIHVAI